MITHTEQSIQSRNQPASCFKQASGTSLTFHPGDDALIKEAESDTNFGYMPNLNAKYGVGSRVDSLMKFALDCQYTDSIVSRAVLKLYCKNGAPSGGKLITVFGTWAEDAVTWNNASFSSTQFYEQIGRVRQERWVEIDVTSAITSMEGDEVTFRIEGLHSNSAVYSSKEEDTHAPTLEIFF